MSTTQTTPITSTNPAERLEKIRARLREVVSSPFAADMLEMAMAVAVSPRLASPDAPAPWLLFVAPPSLGKTATVELLRDTQGQGLTKFVITPSRAALASGFKDAKGNAAASLLRELDGRCWVDPEFNAVLSGDPRKVGELFGALTAAFDGTYTPAFGNQIGSSSVVAIRCRFS